MKYGRLVAGLCAIGAVLSAFLGHAVAGIPGAAAGVLIFAVFVLLSVG
ncbi:MAG TPA: hypothetical protein VF520_16435 [Thermoleophilaceae bacterium]